MYVYTIVCIVITQSKSMDQPGKAVMSILLVVS